MAIGGPKGRSQASAEYESQEARLKEWFQAGVTAARAGRLQQARSHLRRVTAHDPQNEEAWLWLASVADDPQETLVCLAQALTINPRNEHAKAAIRWARAKLVEESRASSFYPTDGVASPTVATPPSSPVPGQAASASKWMSFRRAVGLLIATLLLGLVGLVLFTTVGAEAWRVASAAPTPTMNPTAMPLSTATLTPAELIAGLRPELDQAWQAGDWQRALEILEQIQAADPAHEGLQQGLFTAHLLRGLELVEANQLEEAIVHFERALAIRPGDPTAQSQRQAALGYLAGMKSYRQADWDRAVEELTAVYNMDPNYKEVSAWLYSAHLNRGLAMQGHGQLAAAQGEYQRALEVMSDGEDARIKLAEVTFLLTPPTPTPRPIPNKRIEVDISEQHFYAYEGDALVYSFVCSTGEPGRDTAPGRYQVLDKIPMAYASTWNLKMPYWLGIYWAGTLENGIHALPILSSGQKLWDGYLGQRVSYGCIILSTEAARTIYDWAEVGTPVIIRR
ncbi:MAG TPA: tetratricopeptide repeat protein [Anaerolineae bacterium]|nr:tetratricopeptide repeat protein [Anaerolineae bacterium]